MIPASKKTPLRMTISGRLIFKMPNNVEVNNAITKTVTMMVRMSIIRLYRLAKSLSLFMTKSIPDLILLYYREIPDWK